MATDIIELVRRQLTPEVAIRLSAFTGESPTVTERALSAAVPTTVAGMLNAASAPGGLDRVVGLFGQGRHSGSILSNFSGLLEGEGLDRLLRSGGSIVNTVFGRRQDAVTAVIANSSDARQSSSGLLLSAVAPLVLGAIGRQLSASGGVSSSSLLDLLQGQRNAIVSIAPRGLASALGTRDLASLGTNLERPVVPQRETVPPASATPRSRNWLPLLAGIAALLLLIPLIRGFVQRSAPIDRAAVTMDTLETGTRPSAVGTAQVALPGGRSIEVGENTVVYNLQRFLADKSDTELPKRFRFDNLNFASNSATPTPESMTTVDNLVAVLSAYPTTVIQLQGHTDNTGNAAANRRLSQERASAVARLLASAGIDSGRVTAKGYGADRPIASNETEDGRAQNRRTELVVVER